MVLLGIGLYFCRRNESIEDYLLGGRKMGSWVTALSTQASDMSGWLLMGLPGAIYLGGMAGAWIAIGLFIGTVLNWKLVAGRIRLYTHKTESITLPTFFERRFADPTGLLRVVSSIIILLFFTIYASSGMVAGGKLFESTFGVPYSVGVWIGGAIIVLYTCLGGFLAVCWTDLFQGCLMVLALVVVPMEGLAEAGGLPSLHEKMAARGLSLSLLPHGGTAALIGVGSAMAWGLGYFGQPHLLVRFMSIESLAKLPASMAIAVAWVAVSLTGAVVIGLVGIGLFDSIPGGDPERVFLCMIDRAVPRWLAGIMLSAILSAIMSTIDSQLLVCSSTLTEDLYRKVLRRDAGQRRIVLVGRICVIAVSTVALFLALHPNDTILGIVAYAWGGFGAAFGPLVLFSLFSRRTTWWAALVGMITGTIVLITWRQLGLSTMMYELVPGFVANSVTILMVNRVVQQNDATVLRQFDEVTAEIRQAREVGPAPACGVHR